MTCLGDRFKLTVDPCANDSAFTVEGVGPAGTCTLTIDSANDIEIKWEDIW